MKRLGFSILLSLCSFIWFAQAQPSLAKMSVQMEKLRMQGRLLEAMDTATLILTYDKDYRLAVDYVYRNWDKTMQSTNRQLASLNDDTDLSQAQQRCEIYRVLDEVYDNLRQVRMPLYGPNQKWVWQPEIGYYTGHYDDERIKTFNLLLVKADEALKSFNAQQAADYYRLALNKYLLTPSERNSNKKQMLQQCNITIDKYCDSDKIYHAIFCHELCTISLELDADQPLIAEKQIQIQKRVAALYLEEAENALQTGDTIKANEYKLAADDWEFVEPEE